MAERKTRGIASFRSAEDLTGKEGRCVKLGASGLEAVKATTDEPVGVVLDGGAEGEMTDVALLGAFDGTLAFKAGGAIAAGKRLMMQADGAVDDTAAGLSVGIALEDAAEDELFEGAPRTPVTVA